MVTKHIGLIATGSTTFDAPYHIARRFASLDHISGGRAGWNIVTTSNPDAALNFGMEEHMEHGERYARAREFYDVVTGLWDSWADDAFIRDQESGIFVDPEKMHVLNHRGKYLSVRGPVNIARPVQGWPLIVQAGASESGKQLAAETAEAVFTSQGSIEAGRAFYADVKGRMERLGRNRDHMKIMPGCLVVIGETVEEAKAKRARLDSLVHYANAIGTLSIALGTDASKYDPDKPLPDDIPESNASKSGRERAIALAKRENLTVRQLAQRLGGHGGLGMVGTPKTIADEMEEWVMTDACDGFTIQFPYLPGGLDDFVDKVVPELQRRGLLRKEYAGTTLRENLGLPRPKNRFFEGAQAAAAE
jgi:alkanesulfonate monooxygenase